MINFVKDILLSPFGSFASVFALFVLAFWLVHWITKKVTEIKTEHGELTNHLKETEGRLEKRIDNIDTKIDNIRTDFSYLKGTLEMMKPSMVLAKAKSPISLTDEGIKISNKISAPQRIERNWDNIFKYLEENIKEKNPYDIQEFIRRSVAVEPEKYFSEEDLLGMKNFAFEQGNNLMYYSIIYAILIRDKYLLEKGINISEVDKYDPENK